MAQKRIGKPVTTKVRIFKSSDPQAAGHAAFKWQLSKRAKTEIAKVEANARTADQKAGALNLRRR